ncbi:MAG: hypothetical protein J6Y94_06115, partial [Bacteriovoracaceae bacterium]|nr:hypothetical protein [Bacteriovoracaceae bacterium]
ITQEGGQGGKGGVMGLYGLSGPGGKGGDGDSYRERVSTIETLWGVFHKYKTHTQPAGADGISPQRETNRPAGRGRDGLAYLGPRAEYKFAALSRLRQEHHKVEQALVNFHWERLFIHLLEYTAGQLTEDQILQTPVRQTTQWQDKISTEFFRHPQKVAAVWQDFFISPLQKMVASDELVLEGAADVRQVIHQAQQFTQLMGQISAQPASVQQIKKFVQAQKGSFAARLHDIFDACQKYLNLLAQEKIGFRYWQIPACHALGTTEPLAAARVALQLPLLWRDTQLAYLGAWQ